LGNSKDTPFVVTSESFPCVALRLEGYDRFPFNASLPLSFTIVRREEDSWAGGGEGMDGLVD